MEMGDKKNGEDNGERLQITTQTRESIKVPR